MGCLRRELLLSLAFHALLFGAAWLALRPARQKLPAQPRQAPVQVEIVSAPRSRGSRGGAPSRGAAPSVPLARLGIPFSRGSSLRARLPRPEANEPPAFDPAAEARTSKALRYLYEMIDRELTYPAELASRGMAGTVSAHIKISGSGEYLEAETRFEADSPYLKVVAARALRRALVSPIPREKRVSSGPLEIDCAFLFRITEHNDPSLIADRKAALGSELTFFRNFQHSILQWDLGPLHGLGPLAGLDIGGTVDAVAGLFSHKAKIDPLEQYREDPVW